MQQERESAELCLNGCGFFGAPGSGGMCSVCWKKTMSNRQVEQTKVEQRSTPVISGQETIETITSTTNVTITEESSASGATSPPNAPLVQKNKKRCWECKKKVGLTAIECRCGYVFCSNHRYADQHSCTFDFKAADRAELAKRNPGGGQFGKIEKL